MDAIDFLTRYPVELPRERPDGDFLNYARGLLADYRREMEKVSKTSLVNAVIATRAGIVGQVTHDDFGSCNGEPIS